MVIDIHRPSPLRDYAGLFDLVARSMIPGVSRIAALGHHADVDQATVPEGIWPNGGEFNFLTAAASLEIVSSSAQDTPAGTGAATVTLALLDGDYAQSTVTVTLNGTTPVALPGTWLRCNRMTVASVGSGVTMTGANAGTVTLRVAGGGTTISVMSPNTGFARQALFTVPAGHSLDASSFVFSIISGGVDKLATIEAVSRRENKSISSGLTVEIGIGSPYLHFGFPAVPVGEKTDFYLRSVAVSANETGISAGFLGILTDLSRV